MGLLFLCKIKIRSKDRLIATATNTPGGYSQEFLVKVFRPFSQIPHPLSAVSDEFAEWHVVWLAEWHNYAECNICRMTKRNKFNWKEHPFLAPINFTAKAATCLMLRVRLRWRDQKATKDSLISHSRLAFFTQPQRFYLPLLVGLHGITDTTSRKSAIEEKTFWKVTLPSALNLKDVCTINFTGFLPLSVE